MFILVSKKLLKIDPLEGTCVFDELVYYCYYFCFFYYCLIRFFHDCTNAWTILSRDWQIMSAGE